MQQRTAARCLLIQAALFHARGVIPIPAALFDTAPRQLSAEEKTPSGFTILFTPSLQVVSKPLASFRERKMRSIALIRSFKTTHQFPNCAGNGLLLSGTSRA